MTGESQEQAAKEVTASSLYPLASSSLIARFLAAYRRLEELCYAPAPAHGGPRRARSRRRAHHQEGLAGPWLLRKIELDRHLQTLFSRYLEDL